MSARLIEAAKAVQPGAPGEEPVVPYVALVREAVASLVWGSMFYRCNACSFEWEVFLAFGVEGPSTLRETGLYVASPFVVGSCPAWPIKADATEEERAQLRHMGRCEGRMSHVDWKRDREFKAAQLSPDDAPRFVLDGWHGLAALLIPTPALVRARRFHADLADMDGAR